MLIVYLLGLRELLCVDMPQVLGCGEHGNHHLGEFGDAAVEVLL